jgi:dTDP-4-dehydrorhamnose reductase
MRILVTGANGLLGQKLISLAERDEDVDLFATGRRPTFGKLQRSGYLQADITDKDQVQSLYTQTRPEVVIHTAAMTNVDQCEQDREGCWKTNVDAVKYLLEAATQHNAHFIYLSTDFVFDGSHGPLDESAVPNPVNYYGESKVAAEELVKRGGTSWCIIRTVLVYGITRDMSRSNIVLWVKQNLEHGKPIRVVNDQWRTPTLAEDLAMGTYLAAKKKASGIYHISGKDFLTPFDIANLSADYFNLDKALITPVDASVFQQPARRPAKTGFIIDKARRELGYEPRTFREGLDLLARQIADPSKA